MSSIEPLSTLNDNQLLLAFRGCIEASDDGFLFVDTAGNIAYINEAYCNYIGCKREDAVGRPVLDFIESSQLVEAAQNPDYKTQVNALHRVSAKQYLDQEQYVVVNRTHVSDWDGTPLAGTGQIKLVRTTLQLSNAINEVYDELSYYKEEFGHMNMNRFSFSSILGTSKAMRGAKSIAKQATTNDFPVLITGETGTGKENFANAIHYASRRKLKPFIRINCAAIPAELLESELFGYVDGAFTGAKKGGKKGKFELADGGTLFLDEIGDMPLPMQAKILRTLQEGEVERVGAERTISVDVRIIAATNKNLPLEVRENRFRADLYYRLNVMDLRLPPLRQRKEDIPIYIDAFLQRINDEYHTSVQMDDETRSILQRYSWPGNVREVKNAVEHCYALSNNGKIGAYAIPKTITGALRIQDYNFANSNRLDEIMNDVERAILIEEIGKAEGNLRQAALNLGIHRTTLYKKLEKFGLCRKDFEQ